MYDPSKSLEELCEQIVDIKFVSALDPEDEPIPSFVAVADAAIGITAKPRNCVKYPYEYTICLDRTMCSKPKEIATVIKDMRTFCKKLLELDSDNEIIYMVDLMSDPSDEIGKGPCPFGL